MIECVTERAGMNLHFRFASLLAQVECVYLPQILGQFYYCLHVSSIQRYGQKKTTQAEKSACVVNEAYYESYAICCVSLCHCHLRRYIMRRDYPMKKLPDEAAA